MIGHITKVTYNNIKQGYTRLWVSILGVEDLTCNTADDVDLLN